MILNSANLRSPDVIGAVAGGICLVHCVATPFIFVAKVCSVACCSDTPVWWQAVDYFFIIISFAAIYYTTLNSTKKWVKNALWTSWVVLLLPILSHTFKIGILPEAFIYFPAATIIGLHYYNLKFCKCAKQECCTL